MFAKWLCLLSPAPPLSSQRFSRAGRRQQVMAYRTQWNYEVGWVGEGEGNGKRRIMADDGRWWAGNTRRNGWAFHGSSAVRLAVHIAHRARTSDVARMAPCEFLLRLLSIIRLPLAALSLESVGFRCWNQPFCISTLTCTCSHARVIFAMSVHQQQRPF